MRAFKTLQMTHIFWYKCYTPDSYSGLDATIKHSRFGVIYRTIFADHFLNLGHTAKWTPKNTGSILVVVLAANMFFCLCIYALYKDTLVHLYK